MKHENLLPKLAWLWIFETPARLINWVRLYKDSWQLTFLMVQRSTLNAQRSTGTLCQASLTAARIGPRSKQTGQIKREPLRHHDAHHWNVHSSDVVLNAWLLSPCAFVIVHATQSVQAALSPPRIEKKTVISPSPARSCARNGSYCTGYLTPSVFQVPSQLPNTKPSKPAHLSQCSHLPDIATWDSGDRCAALTITSDE